MVLLKDILTSMMLLRIGMVNGSGLRSTVDRGIHRRGAAARRVEIVGGAYDEQASGGLVRVLMVLKTIIMYEVSFLL